MSGFVRPRLSDVARRAGVSAAVVSTVLNDRHDSNIRVSPETAERVREVARELGYLANPAAQSLARGRNHILGVFTYERIFPLAQQNFYHPFLLGIESEAEEQNQDLLLFTSARAADDQGARQIFRGGVNRLGLADGAVLLGREEDRSELARLIKQGYPFVYVGRRELPGAELHNVAADYAGATAGIVRHLAALGHEQLAYLGSLSLHEANRDRQMGYLAALGELGLAADAGWDRRVQLDEVTPEYVRARLDGGATAFVVEDDIAARRLLSAGAEIGLQPPHDFSLALLGDPLEPSDEDRPWTMFRIPREEMGRQAVRLLLKILAGEAVEERVVLTCDLSVGVTTGPPPAGRA